MYALDGDLPENINPLLWQNEKDRILVVKKTGGLSGNLVKDRTLVKDSLTNIQNFDGAAGKLRFNETGNPGKYTVVVKTDDNGVFTFYDLACP